MRVFSGLVVAAAMVVAQSGGKKPAYSYQKVMVTVRDGVKLEPVILTPTDRKGPLPILFRRSPYGVPADAAGAGRDAQAELARAGYIFVVQNLRGRFGSEGTFELSSKADPENPNATGETSDASHSIARLGKKLPNNRR